MSNNLQMLVLLFALVYVDAAAVSTYVTTITASVVPEYFQTSPEIYGGPTKTGSEPFLAATNPVTFPHGQSTFLPASPLQTQEPIHDAPKGPDGNIFRQMGNVSPYHPSPGFGVDEYPLPNGSEIVWVNMLHRHGAVYPEPQYPDPLSESLANASFTGDLAWLNDWKYSLGVDILVPYGRQELYDSGVLHNYLYGHLFRSNQTGYPSKLLMRTTTLDRMRKSAENFAAGFFGLEYDEYVTIEFIIDKLGFNNSLAGEKVCPNNLNYHSSAGYNISEAWIADYTRDAVKRFNALSSGFTWNSTDVYNAQLLCSAETLDLGYSKFCDLFNWQEWLDFEYSLDLLFAGTYGFQSPTSRAIGVGYVQEVLARINHHLITQATASVNYTLDSAEKTFPVNQKLNFDFTHDINLFSTLTAFGLKQFAPLLPADKYEPNRQLIASHIVPYGCRLDIELIDAPQPVNPQRPINGDQYIEGPATKYIHFVLNQRTLPLGDSIASCGKRKDGWCELETWLKVQSNALQEANYDYACHGDYAPPAWGAVSNGAPPLTKT